MQVLKNLYKLAGEEYRMVPNVFAVKAEDALVLIDCGTDEREWQVITENMRGWGIDGVPVTHVLITHAHGDHAGNAAMLQRAGAKIIVGERAVSVEDAENPLNFHYAYQEPCKPFVPDRYVKDGEELMIHGLKFTVIAAPGHSAGDVVYQVEMDGKSILFLGDVFHIDSYGEKAWIGEQWFLDSDYDAYMRSLYRLMHIHADVLLSAHMQGCLRDCDYILRSAFIQAQEKFDGRWNKKLFLKEIGLI
ncbi:MAG: MBL fold metallo-hydrolase [Lachnospiraceae bacterium]|nr:MBL fold metallo-hydrolase [Lachnospiraceae bacterium]